MDTQKVICPHCGREFSSVDTVCPFCGAELGPSPRGCKKKKFLIIFSLLAVLLIFGASQARHIGYLFEDLNMDMEIREQDYPEFDYEYYTIGQDEREALNEGDYYYPDNWELSFYDLTDKQIMALRSIVWEVKCGISRRDAIRKLQTRGYSEADAITAVDAAEIDFSKMALKSALGYLSIYPYSEKGMIRQLKVEGYTVEEAQYAVDHCGTDWEFQAKISLMELLENSCDSPIGFYIKLEDRGFSQENAEKAMLSVEIDWVSQARMMAKDYLQYERINRVDMVAYLEGEGFSHQQAMEGTSFMKH